MKYHIFDKKTMNIEKLLIILEKDFDGYASDRGEFLNHTPKNGNDEDYADDITKEVFGMVFSAIDDRLNTHGGQHRITTVHVYFGSVTTPDGRKSGIPLSEGFSPVQGADLKAPSAVFNSAGKIDHLRTGGTLLNQKYTPEFMEDEQGLQKVLH